MMTSGTAWPSDPARPLASCDCICPRGLRSPRLSHLAQAAAGGPDLTSGCDRCPLRASFGESDPRLQALGTTTVFAAFEIAIVEDAHAALSPLLVIGTWTGTARRHISSLRSLLV